MRVWPRSARRFGEAYIRCYSCCRPPAERPLSFALSPILDPPISQNKEARRPVATEGEALDTIEACPPLSIIDRRKLDELKRAEKQRLAGAAAKERKAFIDRQSERLAALTGIDLASARKTVERWADGVLLPNMVLPLDDPELKGKTVADVLADPAAFEGAMLADPLEGPEYGRDKAKILRRANGTVWINSFAHGRTTYELKLDYTSANRRC